MAKKKRAAQKPPEAMETEDEPQQPGMGGRLARLIFRPRLLLLLAVVISGTFYWPKLSGLLPDLYNRTAYRLTVDRIVVNEPPRWIPEDFVAEVAARAGITPAASLLEDSTVSRLAKAFREHPWVADVIRVRPVHTSGLPGMEVELRYREPVAMVQVDKGMYPVDVNGILLPTSGFTVEDAKRYPLIENIRSAPQGRAGAAWGDPAVTSAARLAGELSPHWKKLTLAAIHVVEKPAANSMSGDRVFQLRTLGGSRIIWGRAPGSKHPGELTAEQKIGRLEKYLADFGGFDGPHGAYEIDIRHWQEISRQPLSSRPQPDRE